MKIWNWESSSYQNEIYTLTVFNGYLYSNDINKIKKWNQDGELVQEWETNHNFIITITGYEGYLYSGGCDHYIYKWDEEGNLILSWETYHDEIYNLKVFNGYLYSAGESASHSNASKIQKWNQDGNLVKDLKGKGVNGNSLIYFNGYIYSSGGSGVQKWNEDLELVKEWTSSYRVDSLTCLNGFIYSGGGNKVQKWTEDGQLIMEWETAHSFTVNTLIVENGYIFSAGRSNDITREDYYGKLPNKIQRWTEDGKLVNEWKSTSKGFVHSLTSFNGNVYAGGNKVWVLKDHSLFFQVFYKAKTVKAYNLDSGILQQISEYIL